MSSEQKLSILTRGDEESWSAFARRIKETKGEAVTVLTNADNNALKETEVRKTFLTDMKEVRDRVRLASKESVVIAAARAAGISVVHTTRMLRGLVAGHPQAGTALQSFSPSLWRQQWRSRLQAMGLLSLPKLRIWLLIGLSAVLFFFVVFTILPSAEVRVWPRKDVVTQTMNITLITSGATVALPTQSRVWPLEPVSVTVRKSIVFKDISPEFIGSDAEATMRLVNKTKEDFILKKGTRLLNQAGMIFRLAGGATIPGSGSVKVNAIADHVDLYGKIIGDRGNVPANVRWELPGLPVEQRVLVYGINTTPAKGGRTAYRSVLQQSDVDLAKKRLEQELLLAAKQAIELKRKEWNREHVGADYQFLIRDTLTRATYSGFTLPMDLLGKEVNEIPVTGSIIYTLPAYDAAGILAEYGKEVEGHIGDGKELIADSVSLDPGRVVVIEYADNLTWIKITVDVTGTEQYVLDPLTPGGARFGKQIREDITGLPRAQALKVVRNLPEVDRAEIRVWPPWNTYLPAIPSNIFVVPVPPTK